MKKIYFFAPFLWLRRIILFLLILLFIIGFVFFFLANSPLAIKKMADTYAGDYNISYDDIKGNALRGIEILNPRFKNQILAKNIQLKWNPNTLATKVVTINKLHIEEGNVNVIKALVASFPIDNNETTSDKENNAFTINATNIDISLVPFMQDGIFISKVILKSDTLMYTENAFSVNNLVFNLDSNMTNISLQGNMQDQVASLSHLALEDINLLALIAFFSEKNTSTEETLTVGEKETTNEEDTSILIPKLVKVNRVQTNILPFDYDPVKIKQITLGASDVAFDIEKLLVKEAVLDLNATSNLSNMNYKGQAKNNHLLGNINITPNNQLYELYGLPLRKEAIANIDVDINASAKRIIADIRAKGTHILQGKKGEFNINIDDFSTHVIYDVNTSKMEAKSIATLSTPYAKNITLTNTFIMDEKISYKGEAKIAKLLGLDAKLGKPLENLSIIYSGNEKSIKTTLNSKSLKGTFDSKDFKTGQVYIETKSALRLHELVELPKELQDARANLTVDVPLDFKKLSQIDAKVNLKSNIVNIDTNIEYAKAITMQGKVDIPKDSLLRAYSKKVKWDALSPIDAKVKLAQDSLALKLKAKALNADMTYALKQGSIKGKINLGGLSTNISGNIRQKLKIQTKVTSLETLSEKLSVLYVVDALPPLEGKIKANIVVDKLETAQIMLSAPRLIYKVDRKTKQLITDVSLVASVDASKIVLESYKGTFNKQKYFSKKTAVITLDDVIEVENLWINDELKITGNYDTQNKKGTFFAFAKNFHIQDKLASIQSKIDLNVQLDGDDTTVIGDIVLLKGSLTPDLETGKSFASDSDIIILQEMKKKKKSPFMDNLSLALKLETKEALRLKKHPVNIQLKPDFTINKDKGGELLYLGSIELLKGGSYIFEKKKFVLDKSHIYFTGDVNKPVLDIQAKYKSLNHLIKIAIRGTPTTPNVNFSSSPSLTREQILSVILFDSEVGGDTKSGNDMMKMMGGAMAKAALADVGIAVDHLVFGEGNSVEVGKKLTNKITVIYINDVIPKVKLKYQHGKRTESVIGVSEESQSYDIIYKRDF